MPNEQKPLALPDFTFEDKFYLENHLDEKTKRTKKKSKKWPKYSLFTTDLGSDGDALIDAIKIIINHEDTYSGNILKITVNFDQMTKLLTETKKYSDFVELVASREILQTGLYMYIFGIPIYTRKGIIPDIIEIEWGEDE